MSGRNVRRRRPRRALNAAFAAAVAAASPAARAATTVPVPNASFEGPTTTFVNTVIDNWQKPAQPAYYDPAAFGGEWTQSTGVFANTAVDQPTHYGNVNGNQAVYMFASPENALFQVLADTYQVGKPYALRVGLFGGGGGMKPGSSMAIQLYYRNAANAIVPIGATPVVYTAAAFPIAAFNKQFVDYSLIIPTVAPGDAWANKPIGVRLAATLTLADLDPNTGLAGGYWDMDNVRVDAPEPASTATLAIMTAAALGARRRRRSSARPAAAAATRLP